MVEGAISFGRFRLDLARRELRRDERRVRLSDLDTGNILFATDSNGSLINSALLFGFALAQSPPVRMCTKTPAPPWCDAVRGDRAEGWVSKGGDRERYLG